MILIQNIFNYIFVISIVSKIIIFKYKTRITMILENILTIISLGYYINRFNNIDTRIDNLENKVDNLENKVDNLENKVDNLENKVDEMKNDMNKKFDKLFALLENK